ncbi:hypothetical protein AC579_8693 [Pseudocercospora musae]|uniref:Uncharacterized protein n=1 Tax=Pseudocercospora musae TaxID=113226 RepID=A0A139I0E1_9PEZI|nr:hypothetical protein AC579_8693 [Pseudocercospora musae]
MPLQKFGEYFSVATQGDKSSYEQLLLILSWDHPSADQIMPFGSYACRVWEAETFISAPYPLEVSLSTFCKFSTVFEQWTVGVKRQCSQAIRASGNLAQGAIDIRKWIDLALITVDVRNQHDLGEEVAETHSHVTSSSLSIEQELMSFCTSLSGIGRNRPDLLIHLLISCIRPVGHPCKLAVVI